MSGLTGILGLGLALLIVALLALLGTGTLSPSGSGGTSPLSNSRAEHQLQLCVEGRASIYGDPPSPSQQAACTRELAGQIGGGPVATLPLPTATTIATPLVPSPPS